MDIKKIRHMIIGGEIYYSIGDMVRLLRRKANGYPRFIEDGKEYRVGDVRGDSLVLYIDNPRQIIKINKTYMIGVGLWRSFLLLEILGA